MKIHKHIFETFLSYLLFCSHFCQKVPKLQKSGETILPNNSGISTMPFLRCLYKKSCSFVIFFNPLCQSNCTCLVYSGSTHKRAIKPARDLLLLFLSSILKCSQQFSFKPNLASSLLFYWFIYKAYLQHQKIQRPSWQRSKNSSSKYQSVIMLSTHSLIACTPLHSATFFRINCHSTKSTLSGTKSKICQMDDFEFNR